MMKSQNLDNIEENVVLICQALNIHPPLSENGSVNIDGILAGLVENGIMKKHECESITKKE